MQKKSTLTFPFLRRFLARALTRGSRARAPSMAVTREQVRLQAGFRCVAARGGRGDWQTMTCDVVAKWTRNEDEEDTPPSNLKRTCLGHDIQEQVSFFAEGCLCQFVSPL